MHQATTIFNGGYCQMVGFSGGVSGYAKYAELARQEKK